MRSTIKRNSQCGGAQFSVVGRQTMITNTTNRYRVYVGRITITVAIVVCEATVPCCPDVDITFAISSLKMLWINEWLETVYVETHKLLHIECNKSVHKLLTSCVRIV